MRRRTASLVALLAPTLACGGLWVDAPTPEPLVEAEPSPEPAPTEAPEPPEDPTEPPWIDAAVAHAIELETMPGTSGEPDDEQLEALRAFFLAHPEYEDPDARERLADLACAVGFLEAHDRVQQPVDRTPYVVDVAGPGWKLVVAHADAHCTSDDWSWFTNEVQTALAPEGVAWGYAGAEHDVLVVTLGGAEVQRVDLVDQGYLLLQDGRAPVEVGHDLPEGVIERARAAFGG